MTSLTGCISEKKRKYFCGGGGGGGGGWHQSVAQRGGLSEKQRKYLCGLGERPDHHHHHHPHHDLRDYCKSHPNNRRCRPVPVGHVGLGEHTGESLEEAISHILTGTHHHHNSHEEEKNNLPEGILRCDDAILREYGRHN